jgi:hypothetical protein
VKDTTTGSGSVIGADSAPGVPAAAADAAHHGVRCPLTVAQRFVLVRLAELAAFPASMR